MLGRGVAHAVGDLLARELASPQEQGRLLHAQLAHDLAQQLAVSRNTIDTAYQQLLAEGYIYSRPGSGYYSEHMDDFYNEVCKVSHREYYTGFYYGDSVENGQNYRQSSYIRDYEVIAEVVGYDSLSGCMLVKQKNKFAVGDVCEILEAGKTPHIFTIDKIYDENNNEILAAPHPEMLVKIKIDKYVGSMSFVRRRKG